MIGEESWFKSFMGGEKNKPAPPEPDTDSLETTQENSGVDEETDKIRRIREARLCYTDERRRRRQVNTRKRTDVAFRQARIAMERKTYR